MKRRNYFLIAVVIFLLIAIPLTIYLALTRQFIFKRAAFGDVTVNLVPTQVDLTVGDEFTIEAWMNSNQLAVSGATLDLNIDPREFSIVAIQPVAPFSNVIRTNRSQSAFTLLVPEATSNLPQGNVKIATITIRAYAENTTGTITIRPSSTEFIGYNGQNTDVSLNVQAGTPVAYTITGTLCRVEACPLFAATQLSETLRTDNKYDVNVAWTASSGTSFYKLYRAVGTPVPSTHPAANHILTTDTVSYIDTNNGQGFSGGAEIHYDVDPFIVCP